MGIFDLGPDKPKITESELEKARSSMRSKGVSEKEANLIEGVLRSHGSKGIDEKSFEGGMDWLAKHGKSHGMSDRDIETAREELKKKL